MAVTSTSSETRLERSVRFWKLRDKPVGWWPWGLLWLAGLLVTFLWGVFATAPSIEATAQSSVSEALNAYQNTVVEADGQFVSIETVAPESERSTIEALARGAACDSWAGPLVCPIKIDLTLSAPAAQLVAPRLHDFEFTKRDAAIRLAGEVSDNAAKDRIRRISDADARPINYDITVSNAPGMPMDLVALARAEQILPLLDAGKISWMDGAFSVTGLVSADNAQTVRELFANASPELSLGKLTLQVPEEVSRCNDTFAALLDQTSIRFRTGSANIDSRSSALLEQLAAVASDCEGDLSIEGHTDNVGSDENNLLLSQQRADAVVAALTSLGVAPARMSAQGFGETAPIGDNTTSAGRAQNRRIVIAIQSLDQ